MKKLVATIVGLLLFQSGLLRAQTFGQPPVEACKPGDFTVIGWPNEFGPKEDSRFEVLIDSLFDGGFLTREPIWIPVIEQAVPKWNGIAGSSWEFQVLGVSGQGASDLDGRLTISACGLLFPCPKEPPPTIPPGPEPPDFAQTIIAVTLVSSDGGVARGIADADIFFNPELPLNTQPRGDQIDFESVLLHELGHALGLDHNDNCVVGPTIMESVISLGEVSRSLQPAETEGVKFLYPDDATAAIRVFDRDVALRFDALEGGLPPFPQTVSIFGPGGGRWVTTVTTDDGGSWLVPDPDVGRFPLDGTLEVSVDSRSLAAGDYQGTISMSIEGRANPATTIDVELHVVERLPTEQRPFLTRAGIVNGANMLSPRLAPGSLFTVFGEFLAPTTTEADSVPLPTRLGGTEVLVNAVPAPLLFVSPTQINGHVPVDLLPGRGGIVVRTGLGETPPIPVDLMEAAPELFLLDGDQALVLNQDNTVNSADNPAAQGSVVSVFLTGQGPVSPPVPSGRAAPVSPLARVIDFSSATIGEQEAQILFFGLAPGFVGLAQANIELPADLSGRLGLQITAGETASNVGFVSVE